MAEGTVGECRRFPPGVLTNEKAESDSIFPLVFGDAWCGEYEEEITFEAK